MQADEHAGAHIKAARLRLGWSQAQLAAKLSVSQPTVAHWERGSNTPRAALLPRIAALLELRRDDLVRLNSAPALKSVSVDPILNGTNRNIPIYEWPRTPELFNQMLNGEYIPLSYVGLSHPGPRLIAMILEDYASEDHFNLGSVGVFDLDDTALNCRKWYLFAIKGLPTVRRWRSKDSSELNGIAKNNAELCDDESMPLWSKPVPVGRLVLTIQPA